MKTLTITCEEANITPFTSNKIDVVINNPNLDFIQDMDARDIIDNYDPAALLEEMDIDFIKEYLAKK